MSFTLLLAVTAAVAASMGYMAARKHGDEPGPDDEEGSSPPPRDKGAAMSAPVRIKPGRKKPAASPFADLPLALGDVVSSGSEERWLAGAIVAREGEQVIGAVFLAPEGKVNKAIAVFAPPRKEIWWMSPAEVPTAGASGEPPGTIEVLGGPMPRKARLPVSLERVGQGAPAVGEEGLWAVYERGAEVALVVASGGQVFAWSGSRLEPHDYERLGGGGD